MTTDADQSASEPRKFFKTTYTVVVLSEDSPATGLSLAELAAAINDDCSGQTEHDAGVELTSVQMAQALKEQGSSPEFFRLADDGSDLGDVDEGNEDGSCPECGFDGGTTCGAERCRY